MSLMRYNPRAMTPWFDLDRFFEDFEPGVGLTRKAGAKAWTPAVDIFEDEKEIVIKADLPEVKEEDLDVRVEDGQLTLKGERKFEHEEKKDNYHRVERRYGSFQRTFGLPENVDAENIVAKYDKGVLKVTLPKVEKPKNARTIPVK
ncbi:MAG: Hsp20/alpha crystallin family protein [Acidobacteria bacterium]|nr:Hsp20/alpha crystallin family protein [Acidobacteriota bacterium]